LVKKAFREEKKSHPQITQIGAGYLRGVLREEDKKRRGGI